MMVPANPVDHVLDPVEVLNQILEQTWEDICRHYDVMAGLPEMDTLFADVDLNQPKAAADAILRAMLLEIIEAVGRFSPWYSRPARAFGLVAVRELTGGGKQWVLAPETKYQWRRGIEKLAAVIGEFQGVIRAALLVEGWMRETPVDPNVPARCQCMPPREIHIRKSVLCKANIICPLCKQPFT